MHGRAFQHEHARSGAYGLQCRAAAGHAEPDHDDVELLGVRKDCLVEDLRERDSLGERWHVPVSHGRIVR